MRISVFEDDPGYLPLLAKIAGHRCVVTVDGVEQTHVQTADEEEGFVDRNVLENPDDPNSFKVDYDKHVFVLERVHGVVKIMFTKEAAQ
jgi:hypothetical protein